MTGKFLLIDVVAVKEGGIDRIVSREMVYQLVQV